MTSLQFRPKSFEHEEYGMVVESLGGNKVKVLCMDGHVRLSSIMGKLQKTQWIKPGFG
jgi:initiation factor 1A